MKGPILVLDTSFLWDLYGIPQRRPDPAETQRRSQNAKARLRGAILRASDRFLPYLVIFECANAIAKVVETDTRRQLANRFVSDVQSSLDEATPWVITPDGSSLARTLAGDELRRRCEQFRDRFVDDRIGLVDLFVHHEAERLKRAHGGRAVHIWTGDEALKKLEPDHEPDNWWRS